MSYLDSLRALLRILTSTMFTLSFSLASARRFAIPCRFSYCRSLFGLSAVRAWTALAPGTGLAILAMDLVLTMR
ncbi:hypothetical protein BJ912DRAFT_969512 [Pholiota molesta]|nr:hypothetical protein BJ912DRAFT_969512 [Pholiota molesta]